MTLPSSSIDELRSAWDSISPAGRLEALYKHRKLLGDVNPGYERLVVDIYESIQLEREDEVRQRKTDRARPARIRDIQKQLKKTDKGDREHLLHLTHTRNQLSELLGVEP